MQGIKKTKSWGKISLVFKTTACVCLPECCLGVRCPGFSRCLSRHLHVGHIQAHASFCFIALISHISIRACTRGSPHSQGLAQAKGCQSRAGFTAAVTTGFMCPLPTGQTRAGEDIPSQIWGRKGKLPRVQHQSPAPSAAPTGPGTETQTCPPSASPSQHKRFF